MLIVIVDRREYYGVLNLQVQTCTCLSCTGGASPDHMHRAHVIDIYTPLYTVIYTDIFIS
jgi:hypothetical protein